MISLEPATVAHAEALAGLHALAFPERERWSASVMALQLGLPGAFGWITEAGGMVLARVAADEAEILTLAVDPAAQRRGVGRALLHQAMHTAASGGAVQMFLEVAESNGPARALYAQSGFTEVGRRRSYYDNKIDALVLRASIACESRLG